MRYPQCVLMLVFVGAVATGAEEDATKTDEARKKADPGLGYTHPAFSIQGEYEGKLSSDGETKKLGVQVIADRDGFVAVAYHGGLPGAGWDRGEKTRCRGKSDDGAVEFAEIEGGATLRDGALTVRGKNGKVAGTLKRVERKSPTLGAKPPEGVIVLFGDGENNFKPGERKTADGLLAVPARSEHVFEKDFQLHLEFRVPFKPQARGQGRGNSGVYLLGRYEIQVLDSFGLDSKNGDCGAFYGRKPPDVNMCFPPLSWQTYDVDFTMARLDDKGEVVSYPIVTVRHNGVVVHDQLELKEAPRRNGRLRQPATSGTLNLQKHDNRPINYRNIWVVERESSSASSG